MNISHYAIAISLAMASAPSIAQDSIQSSDPGPAAPGTASISNLEPASVRFEISRAGKPWAMYRLHPQQTKDVPCFKQCLLRIAGHGGADDAYPLMAMERYAIRYNAAEETWLAQLPRGKVDLLPLSRVPVD